MRTLTIAVLIMLCGSLLSFNTTHAYVAKSQSYVIDGFGVEQSAPPVQKKEVVVPKRAAAPAQAVITRPVSTPTVPQVLHNAPVEEKVDPPRFTLELHPLLMFSFGCGCGTHEEKGTALLPIWGPWEIFMIWIRQ